MTNSEVSQKEMAMETWLVALISLLIGSVVGATTTYFFMLKNPKKPPMSYDEYRRIFRDSRNSTLIIGSLKAMGKGDLSYPRWRDVLRLYKNSDAISPIEYYGIWIIARRFKKEKEVLQRFPNCQEIYKRIIKGEPPNKTRE
ncbi:hypothetical protein A2473_01340 [candidate division WWE3 bacterium RIFOXYC2_FULL_42_13]|uniref:Uncharacterized protein n=1 Tax=candidate division WWE3 bacterium TaxID=2053526 RepID=A0A3D0ZPQ3_UNCKA|nr:MAG: hypothetical protein A2245_02155 [candidate division WWE3 bacterium RIFOXYA2_FULL_43_12]OGC73653.1 MAG: hypothetical protein A2473_01340 [candidate division WWE3 bacterium RIFOXYC2_FULL_42_13]OGC74099.1 MAG: hypothetical protein A2337_00045 [candidate division WWE3 bacterium RIFOXYB2_FULL_43_9]OGC75225.1 MAG: hypothetical protein A2547_02325 [candidate division WWE3 bacterium RIFOXYD2_FULL_43_10]HBY10358.1 hypothetical protein [candidate division WWE3 bacterium]